MSHGGTTDTQVYSGFTNHFNIGALMEKGVRFIGNGQAPVHLYWEEIMEYLQNGTFDTRFLVTHRVGIEDFPALYKAFDERVAGGTSTSRALRGNGS